MKNMLGGSSFLNRYWRVDAPLDRILACWLIGNAQGLCYVFGFQDTMASVNGEVDNSRIPDVVCSHRLIKV